MKCKFCHAEMEENETLCPVCGKDNGETPDVTTEDEVTAEVTGEATVEERVDEAVEETAGEAEQTEEPAAAPKKMSAKTLAVIYIAALAVIAVLVFFVLSSLGDNTAGKGAVDQNATETQSVEYTTPGKGNKDDVTCKGTYTVSDRKAKSSAGKTIATINGTKLTNADLQVYYWMQVYNFLKSNSSAIDTAHGLDTQVAASSEAGWTYQQYFLDAALKNWRMYYALCQEAEANDFELEADLVAYLDGLAESVETLAKDNGFQTADELLQHDLGAGATLEAYLGYMRNYYSGFAYYGSLAEQTQATEDQVNAFYEENKESFDAQGIQKDDSIYVNVRHILLKPTDDTDEAKEACKKQAEDLLNQWLAGDRSEDSFAELANTHSADPGSNTVGGLYEYVTEGRMVQTFNDWCFDASRKTGDYGIVETSYGYHVMYFCESFPVWYVHAESGAVNQIINDLIDGMMEKYPVDFQYSKMVLGNVDLAG